MDLAMDNTVYVTLTNAIGIISLIGVVERYIFSKREENSQVGELKSLDIASINASKSNKIVN